jgi:hypothetical protein
MKPKYYPEVDSPYIDLSEPASVKSGKSLRGYAVRKAGSTVIQPGYFDEVNVS